MIWYVFIQPSRGFIAVLGPLTLMSTGTLDLCHHVIIHQYPSITNYYYVLYSAIDITQYVV
jgi:hypothetical protein